MADADVLRELRLTRQRKRLVNLEWFELAYKAYVAGLLVVAAVVVVSNLVGDDVLTAAQQVDVVRHAPSAVGLVMALAIALGLRSGARGGPLSVEPAEVQHVLLAPVDRRAALARPAIQQVRRALFVGAAAGAVGGQLLGRRMDRPLVPWVLSGAAGGATVGLAAIAAALLAHALHLPRWQVSVAAGVLLAWQGAAIPSRWDVPGPFDTVGSLVLWPVRAHAVDLVAPVIVLVATVAGLASVGRVSIDALARRSALVHQLRFAVTMRDLRTVVLLRRQLSNEQHRTRPWVKVRGPRRLPIVARGVHSLARFPASRLVRMALLAASAAVAQVGAYRGTTPLVVVSGLAAFVLGLECIEPLAQELDQPDRCDALPKDRGWVHVRHLPVPAVAAGVFALLTAAVVGAVLRTRTAWELALVLAVPVAWGGLAGATLNVLGAVPPTDTPGSVNDLLPPEIAGMREMFRTIRPLLVAVAASVPVLVARHAAERGDDPVPPALQATVAITLLIAAVVWWTRRRDTVKAKMRALWAAGDAEWSSRRDMRARG